MPITETVTGVWFYELGTGRATTTPLSLLIFIYFTHLYHFYYNTTIFTYLYLYLYSFYTINYYFSLIYLSLPLYPPRVKDERDSQATDYLSIYIY